MENPVDNALQIISSDPQGISFDENSLRFLLTRDDVKDRYISVISITGDYRQGKSFLLNFFLRYLEHRYVDNKDMTDWLKPEDGPLKGFSFASGSKRHTTGIMMWPYIFLADSPSGEKIAIIVLDTQGSFDNESTVDECAKIFALSTLISSVQIYNVMRNIKQSDLINLQCFGGYGSLFTESKKTPFQDICFLVRDWPYSDEHAYGGFGGTVYLTEEVLQSNKPEVKKQIENVKVLFEQIYCFLLPYPGQIVNSSKTFVGDLNEIDDTFKEHVQGFVSSILSPENLVLKTVNGKKIKAEDFVCYIQEYNKVLKSDDLPEMQTIFKANIEAQHKIAFQKALKVYKKNMDINVKYAVRFLNSDELYELHVTTKARFVKYYEDLEKIEDDETFDKYLVMLKNAIDEEYKCYVALNLEKRRKHEREMEKREQLRLQEELKRRRAQPRPREEPGTSGLSQVSPETIGIAVGAIGAAAALAFGVSKFFSSKGNNE